MDLDPAQYRPGRCSLKWRGPPVSRIDPYGEYPSPIFQGTRQCAQCKPPPSTPSAQPYGSRQSASTCTRPRASLLSGVHTGPRSITLLLNEHAELTAMLRAILRMVERGPQDAPERFFDVLRAMLFYIDEFPERFHRPKNVFTISLRPRWGAIGMSWLSWTAAWALCPCKGYGGQIARFHPNPKGRYLFGRSASLQNQPRHQPWLGFCASQRIPKRYLRDPKEIVNTF